MSQCEFCPEAEAHGACAWPVERFVERESKDLKVGDIVRRFHEKRETSSVATVAEIGHERKFVMGEPDAFFDVRLRIKGASGVREKTFWANDFSRVRVLAKEPCGAMCCERHIQIRGPGVYVCNGHWAAWQEVA